MKTTYWDCPYNDYCDLVDIFYKHGCLHPRTESGICTRLDHNACLDCELLDDTLMDCVIYNEEWI